jgi:hypothetical protein
MNTPRSKLRDISSKIKLKLERAFVQLDIFFFAPLLFDVFDDGHLVALFADGSRIVAVGPKFSSPELLLDMRTTREDLTRRNAFDELG